MSNQPASPPAFEAIGLAGPEFLMNLELGKLREFARATDAPANPYLTREAPPITPTFLTTARFWEEDNPWPKIKLARERVLHAEQEFVFHGPLPRVGARLVGQSTIETVYVKESRRGPMTFALMVTRFWDPGGRLVAESRMTGVEAPPPQGTPPAAAPAGSPEKREAAGVEQSELRASAHGETPQPISHGPLTITDFVRYQGASGDMNALHHDPAAAREAGFDEPISVGMLQAGLLASYAVSWLGSERIRRFTVRFRAPVLLGDVITCLAAGPATVNEQSVELHLLCKRQTGNLAAEAWAEFEPEPART